MSDFVPGFPGGRFDAAATALKAAFDVESTSGFESSDLKARASGGKRPKSFSPAGEGGPRHFTPLDPDSNPTEGWDPFSADAGTPESAGFVDPIAAAHAAGRAEGYAAALAEAAADVGRDRALSDALGEALNSVTRFDRDRVALRLRQTVLTLVGRLVGEIGISGELIATRIAAAVDILADSAESALLRMHPDDVALVHGKLPSTLFAIGDEAIARGSFVLESASTIVEDGPEQWISQLTQAIDRVAVPPLA